VTRESLCTKSDLEKLVQRLEDIEKRLKSLEKQQKQ
jgi:chaperonin cofactor prefoldin